MTVATRDRELLQDATQMKLDALCAMHFITEAWRLITLTALKNCFVKSAFLPDHVSSNDDSAVKLSVKMKSMNGTVFTASWSAV
jgi:hypothetical protein